MKALASEVAEDLKSLVETHTQAKTGDANHSIQHNSPIYGLKGTDLRHVTNAHDLGFHITSDLTISFDSLYKAIL